MEAKMKNRSHNYTFKEDLFIMLKLMILGIAIGSIIIILNSCTKTPQPQPEIDYKFEDIFDVNYTNHKVKDTLRKKEYNTKIKTKDTNGKY
jgi:hypothetical protein